MFCVTDLTAKPARVTVSNDTKDVRDIIIGITGDEEDGNRAEKVMCHMAFGDEYASGVFRVTCVRDDDCAGRDAKMQEFINTYVSRRRDAFHDDSDIISGLLELFSKEELDRYGYGNFAETGGR